MNKAKYVTDITVTDPDTKAPVEVTIFKHENGGVFGIDASYINEIDEDEPTVCISDPFSEKNVNQVELFWVRSESRLCKDAKELLTILQDLETKYGSLENIPIAIWLPDDIKIEDRLNIDIVDYYCNGDNAKLYSIDLNTSNF